MNFLSFMDWLWTKWDTVQELAKYWPCGIHFRTSTYYFSMNDKFAYFGIIKPIPILIVRIGCKGRLLNIRTTLKLSQGNVHARMVFERKVFISTNLIIKSLQKIRLENIQNRRPRGSSIKHGGFFEIFQCVEPLRMARVQTFLLNLDESWVTLSDQCRNHDFEVLNQSINQFTGYSNNSTTQY